MIVVSYKVLVDLKQYKDINMYKITVYRKNTHFIYKVFYAETEKGLKVVLDEYENYECLVEQEEDNV